jgi:hypothetical protein
LWMLQSTHQTHAPRTARLYSNMHCRIEGNTRLLNDASVDSTGNRMEHIFSSTVMNAAEKKALSRSLLSNFKQNSLKVFAPFRIEKPPASLPVGSPSPCKASARPTCTSPPSTGSPKQPIRGGAVEITEHKEVGKMKKFESKYSLICSVHAKHASTRPSLRACLKRLIKCVLSCHG